MNKTVEFIKKAKLVHNELYDYSKVNYKNSHTKVCIICEKHGEFWQSPASHIHGSGCPFCRGNKSYTLSNFIDCAKKLHGDKYDYSKVDYVNSKTKVCIICPKHGEFWVTPGNHINKANHRGCPKCKIEKVTSVTRKKLDDFINDSINVHGDRYDYSKVDYVNSQTKVCIICPKHGEFWMAPGNHLAGHGCPKCAFEKNKDVLRSNTEEFIEKAKRIHGDKYDYSDVNYYNSNTPVQIRCIKHGEFSQTPKLHLNGCGCPKCQQSHLEDRTSKILNDLSISFVSHCNNTYFDWIGLQHLDFYLPEYNIAIECQGIQHYKPIPYFGGKTKFEMTKRLDEEKRIKLNQHNIDILYINYNYTDDMILEVIKNAINTCSS